MEDVTIKFDYIVNPIIPSHICFGSTMERDTCPLVGRGLSSLMRRLIGIPKDIDMLSLNVAPEFRCSAVAPGYGPMASKVPRFPPVIRRKHVRTQTYTASSKRVRQSARPFGRSLKEYEISSNTPGPGSCTMHDRNIVVQSSFGGPTKRNPTVVWQNPNDDVCIVCKQKPKGMYWKNFRSGKAMCRYCKPVKQLEAKYLNVVLQMEMNEYKRTRFCNRKIGPRALANQLRIENYLSIFRM